MTRSGLPRLSTRPPTTAVLSCGNPPLLPFSCRLASLPLSSVFAPSARPRVCRIAAAAFLRTPLLPSPLAMPDGGDDSQGGGRGSREHQVTAPPARPPAVLCVTIQRFAGGHLILCVSPAVQQPWLGFYLAAGNDPAEVASYWNPFFSLVGSAPLLLEVGGDALFVLEEIDRSTIFFVARQPRPSMCWSAPSPSPLSGSRGSTTGGT